MTTLTRCLARSVLLVAVSLVACDALSPTNDVDLCAGDSPPSDECPRCAEPPYAAGCPRCSGASPEPGCENASNADAGGDGDTGAPLPLVDGGQPGSGGAGGASGMDGGGTGGEGGDAGPDTGIDAGPCPQGCSGKTSLCLRATDTCVECRANADCDGAKAVCDPDTHECVECLKHSDCGGSEPRCDTAAHACVECLADADCTDATAAKCSSAHECVACTGNANCAHIAGKGVCDDEDGECVECKVEDESPCAGNSCAPATRACTGTPLASVDACGKCVADSECKTDHRCVPTKFMGVDRAGGHCLKIGSTGCARPYSAGPVNRTSLSGVAAVAYCGFDESRTTCEAILALTGFVTCSTAGDCTDTGLADARCDTVNLTAGQCTYDCVNSAGCVMGFDCGSGYCGGP